MRSFAPLAPSLLLLAALSCAAVWARPAQAQAPAAQGKAASPARVKIPLKSQQDPVISRKDLLSPYSAIQRKEMGPPRELASDSALEGESVQTNATSWKLDPSLTPRKEDEGPVRLKFGQDKQVDPLTGKELNRKPDPSGAANKLKDLDVKGAADKLGGKAGVEVDVFKF